MIWYDVDAALSEVPVNFAALCDDTDFKSREESVAYNAAGLDLLWNFVTTAGAFTQTAVTPTDTGGNYDWVNQGNGLYTIEMPASGGASINNDTEGFGWFSGYATGILPWVSPVMGFRAAAINNSLIDAGTTGLLAPTTAARTLDVSAGGEAGVDWANVGSPTTSLALTGTTIAVTQKVDVDTIKTNPVVNGGTVTYPTNSTLASTTNITAGTVTTATNLTNAPTAGDLTATMKTSVTTACTAATPNLNAAYDAAKTASTQASVDTVDGIVDAILAMLDNARSEPGQGAPAVNADAMTKLDYLYKWMRNKLDNDGSTTNFYNDAGDTVDQKRATSESGGTVTKGEIVTGA